MSDPNLVYKLKPHSISIGKTEEFGYEYRCNSMGFRDVEHRIEKPQNIFRILGLGDSFTFGIGVPYEETYLFLLEEMLNQRTNGNTKVEIIKAGVPRYFPEVERLLLEHSGIQYRPDLILVSFLPNDMMDTQIGAHQIYVLPKSGYLVSMGVSRPWIWFYLNSHLSRTLMRGWFLLKGKWTNWKRRRSDLPNNDDKINWIKIEKEYGKMIEIAKAHSSNIVFFHVPQKGPWRDSDYEPSKRLQKWAEKTSVPFIDILPAIKQASRERECYYPKDGHCNREGYRVIAETLFNELVRRSLVP